ncbi:MAG: magnesium transporter, partial [Gammaproteobacteria bacterium]
MTVSINHAINALNAEYFRHFTDEAANNTVLLSRKDQVELIGTQPIITALRIWDHLPLDAAVEVLAGLPDELALQCLQKGDPVHAARVIKRLSDEHYHYYLERLDAAKQQELSALVQYPDDSAGTLMDVRFLPLYENLTVREALHRIRKYKPKFSRYLFLLDQQGMLKSRVGLEQLALADGDEKLSDLSKPVIAAVVATATREEVVEQFELHKITDLPVIDIQGRMIGVILYNVLVDESLKETSSDLLTMVGVSKDERGLSSVGFVVKKRLPWLMINLVTA